MTIWHELLGLEFEVKQLFDECGHWPQHERPELYNPLAIAFLKEHSGK